jgi:hypothetical protein
MIATSDRTLGVLTHETAVAANLENIFRCIFHYEPTEQRMRDALHSAMTNDVPRALAQDLEEFVHIVSSREAAED